MSITEFLNARIAEDEEQARICRKLHWFPGDKYELSTVSYARVLAECEAKRAIISMWTPTDLESEDRGAYFYAEGLGDAVKALASIYEDHPDYQHEWRLENTEPLN